MGALKARVYALSIPFKMTFAHARASRSACDSLILEIDDGTFRGYGEAILREYVNGPEAKTADLQSIAERLKKVLEAVKHSASGVVDSEVLRRAVLQLPWRKGELPLVSAVESAFLDLLCKREKKDVYEILGLKPLRRELVYGGVVPLLPGKAAAMMVQRYLQHDIQYLRLKLSESLEQNRQLLSVVRDVTGVGFDVRVDVNCGWDLDTAAAHLDLLDEYGIRLVEEPLGPNREGMLELRRRAQGRDIAFVADESAVTFQDVEGIIADGSFSMLNIRLAKNGGILRSLTIADMADRAGLRYQLGAHVGETGISSITGRITASLMKSPVYIDGSFDEYILSDNVTTRSFSFGAGGKASIVRSEGIGYETAPDKLEMYAHTVAPVL